MGHRDKLFGRGPRGAVTGVVGLLLLVGLGGCNSLGPACTDILMPGIRLFVVDSVSGAAVAADGHVIASDGAYADTTFFAAARQVPDVYVVEDRPGAYTVRVTAAGYAAWERRDVRVTREDACHVRTMSLTARLAR